MGNTAKHRFELISKTHKTTACVTVWKRAHILSEQSQDRDDKINNGVAVGIGYVRLRCCLFIGAV